MDLTLNDLKALKAFTEYYANKHPKFIGISVVPELSKRWYHISRFLQSENMEAILGNKCISFKDEDRFNSFVSRIDDLIEDIEIKRRCLVEANKSAYYSSRSTIVSALCAFVSLIFAALGVLHIL